MASQLAVWRGGFRKLQFQQWEEKRQQDVISAAADAAKVAHRLAEKQHEQLLETIRKVTNEHAVVSGTIVCVRGVCSIFWVKDKSTSYSHR